jgi:D-arabinose 5-phosphate isomerase GutQ
MDLGFREGKQKMIEYFEETIRLLSDAIRSIDERQFSALVDDCERTLKAGHKIIASGLGKNVPVCEKFEGTMLSLGMDCNFMHTNSAVHGDLGMVKPGDLVIILTKSGSTIESVYLYEQLRKRDSAVWLLSFNREGKLSREIPKSVFISLEHEGDRWNVLPNNSTTMNLIVLQALAMELAKRLDIKLEDFKPNHPAGAIGESLRNI